MNTSTQALSPAARRLIGELKQVNYGRIEGLAIRDGEPDMTAPLRVIHEIKIGGENGPHALCGREDCSLKSAHLEMLAHFARLKNAIVHSLEIKNGLPFRIQMEERRG